eukprot:sb/3467114/
MLVLIFLLLYSVPLVCTSIPPPPATTSEYYADTTTPIPIHKLTCQLVEINGYLHDMCIKDGSMLYHRCPRSNESFSIILEGKRCGVIFFSSLCPFDPGFYQACGFGECSGYRELGGTPLLCGTYICRRSGLPFPLAGTKYENTNGCNAEKCSNTELNMVGCSKGHKTCNNICDEEYCFDESFCNGVQYGVWCDTKGVKTWYPPSLMCFPFGSRCDNHEDTEGCFDFKEEDHTTFSGTWGITIKIQQSMRVTLPRSPSGVIAMTTNFVMTGTIMLVLNLNQIVKSIRDSCVMDTVTVVMERMKPVKISPM